MSPALCILIVDDDPSVREVMEAILQKQGYNIAKAESGMDALNQLKVFVPDVILLDLMMPEMDGIEVCRHIRQNPQTADIPIIMLTALEDRNIRIAAIKAGTDDFIQKPYDRLEVEARVKSLANFSRLRRQRQTELREERDNKLAILNALGEAVVVTDRAGIIEYVNPAFTKQTGYTESETVGRTGYEWLSPTISSQTMQEVNEAIRNSHTWQGELINRCKDGSFYHAAVTVAPIFGTHTPTLNTGIVTTFRNITVIKEAQQLKEKFVSNISHELRTPLSVLTLLSGNLDNQFDHLDNQKQKKIVRDIRVQSRVLNELMNSVLALIRLDNVPLAPPKSVLDLAQLVTEEVEKQVPLAQKKEQLIKVNGTPSVNIHANDQQMRQIVRNFVNNAIKYTLNGGNIETKCVIFDPKIHTIPTWPGANDIPHGEWAVFRIQDNGIGINKAQLPHIFGRFYRASPHSALPGAGLGLSIARELIELHNGCVHVQSEENAGTIFTIYLPLAQNNQPLISQS